jgi:predicted DNA-binding transcriptional regulator YafY
VHTGRRWYLVAWDVDRGGWRTFRADRIAPRIPTGPRFTPREPPDPDLAAYVTRGAGSAMWQHQARIRLHVPASAIAHRITPAMGTLEPLDDGHCEFRTGADTLRVLATYLALLDVDFDVLDPPELVEHVRAIGERYLRAGT